MIELHKYLRLILIIGAVIGGLYILLPLIKMDSNTHIHNHIHTDTSLIKKEYQPLIIKPNNTPVKVDIYLKADTALRNKTVSGPVIVGEELKGNTLKTTTIDDSGKVKIETHKLDPDDKSLKINSKGEVEEKKRTKAGIAIRKVGKRAKQVVEVVAIVYTAYKLLTGKL